MKLVVYIDVYFVLNGIFDFCVLLLVGRLRKRRKRLLRLAAGAAAGGLGAAIILFLSVLPLSLRVALQYGLLPVVMLLVSFGFLDKRSFFHQLLSFYGVTLLLGGALSAFWGAGRKTEALLAAGAMFCFLFRVLIPMMERRQRELQREYEVAVNLGDSWIHGRGLLDTGNRLYEPVSGKPVVLAEFSVVQKGLPKELRGIFEEIFVQGIQGELLKEAAATREEPESVPGDSESGQKGFEGGLEKIRWIPYQAIGTKRGLIPGVEALRMKLWMEGNSITKEGVLLGIVFEPLAGQGEYQFILHEDIMC